MFPSRIRLHLSVCAVGSLLRPRSDSTVVVSRGLSVSTQHDSVREYRFFYLTTIENTSHNDRGQSQISGLVHAMSGDEETG